MASGKAVEVIVFSKPSLTDFMGDTDFIFNFWEKEQKLFNKNLAVLKKHPGKNAVHDLRVAVKKLRAALELYLLISGKLLPEERLKETEQLFSILGKQRDIEICLEIVVEFEKETGKKYSALKNYFRSVLSFAQKGTKKAVQQYKKKELEEMALLLKNETQIIGQEELKNKIDGIIHIHIASCKDYYNKPHKLRQELKEIYYWIKMIPDSLCLQFGFEKELQELLEDFGNWQNFVVIEIRIKHFRKDYLPKISQEYNATKMLETAIKEKKEDLLELAFNKTSGLLKKTTQS